MTRSVSVAAGVIAVLLSLVSSGPATVTAQPTAFVGATIHPVASPKLERGTIVVMGDSIMAIGQSVPIPDNARVIDVLGKTITPGFIHANAHVGLIEIGSETVESRVSDNNVSAGLSLLDAVNPASQLIPVTRAGGVTSVVSVPLGGLISGKAIALQLTGDSVEEMVIRPNAAVVGYANRSSRSSAGGSMSGVFNKIRTLLRDVQDYAQRRNDFDSRRIRDLSASKEDLDALVEVLDGEVPLLLTSNRRSDIEAVLRIAEDFGINIIVRGGKEAWMVAGRLNSAGVGVILDPLENVPSYDALQPRLDNAAILTRSGVTVAFTVSEEYNPRLLRQHAGNAVAQGMSWDDALRATTINPARIFGFDSDRGTLETGKKADLVVWSGDPFELSSRAEIVMIAGQQVSLRSRQTLLMEKYRDLLSVGGG